jgi:hypothetical protein
MTSSMSQDVLNDSSICAESATGRESCDAQEVQDGHCISGAQAIASLSKYRKEIAELTVSMQEVRGFDTVNKIWVNARSQEESM